MIDARRDPRRRAPPPVTPGPDDDDGPSRGLVAIGFVMVVIIVGLAFTITRSMMETARLQDCAVSGQTNC